MTDKTKELILKTVSKLGKTTVTELIRNLPDKKSRQWISVILNQMASDGQLVRTKSGRFVFYVQPERINLIGNKVSRVLRNKNLDEDVVFNQMSDSVPFIKKSKEDIHSILEYGFTEMLNNAMDHSKSESIEVKFEMNNEKIIFEVKDKGIGAFKNIMNKKHLASEIEAIQELLKGKTTTLPHSHSGEGIFFTSKIADIFILDSFEYRLRVDNNINDVFIEKIKSLPGTKVRFEISSHSKKHLSDIFFEYEAEPGSYSFDKTKVQVKLFKAGTVYISRSQAKRLLVNLEKFKLVVLDFSGIDTIGQAFADEIFRVFMNNHPQTKIDPINTSETVNFMIQRARQSSKLKG